MFENELLKACIMLWNYGYDFTFKNFRFINCIRTEGNMFTSVANYLFGTSEEATEKSDVELKETPADHDESWTVIDLPGNLDI